MTARPADKITDGRQCLLISLLTASPDMIFRLKGDGTIMDFYAAAEVDPSISVNDMIGMNIDTVYSPEITRQIKAQTLQALQSGKLHGSPSQIEINGLSNHIESRFIPCGTNEVIVIFSDITTKKQMEDALRKSVHLFKNAFDHAATCRTISAPYGKILRVNQSFCQMLGYSKDQLLSKTWFDITHPDDLKTRLEYARDLIAGVIPSFNHIHRLVRQDRNIIWVDLTVVVLRDKDSTSRYFVGDVVDITERVRTQQTLKDSEELYREFVEGTDDLITRVDAQSRFTFVNHRAREIFGINPEECSGLSSFDFVHPEDRNATRKAFESWLEHRITNATYENRQINRNGRVHHMLWTINIQYGSLGEIISVNGIARDITERKLSEQILEYLATHDSLTGLPNRVLFSDRLRHALSMAKRANKFVAVMFIDLDGFKSVNDAFGHEMGDQVLKRVALILKSCVRESDTVSRFSGDEFTLVIENLSAPPDAAIIAEKIINQLTEPFNENGQQINITASIGISLFPNDGDDEICLLKRADTAMYLVKNTTKNGFRFYS